MKLRITILLLGMNFLIPTVSAKSIHFSGRAPAILQYDSFNALESTVTYSGEYDDQYLFVKVDKLALHDIAGSKTVWSANNMNVQMNFILGRKLFEFTGMGGHQHQAYFSVWPVMPVMRLSPSSMLDIAFEDPLLVDVGEGMRDYFLTVSAFEVPGLAVPEASSLLLSQICLSIFTTGRLRRSQSHARRLLYC